MWRTACTLFKPDIGRISGKLTRKALSNGVKIRCWENSRQPRQWHDSDCVKKKKHLVKSRALTICMENRWKFSGKKVMPFEVLPFSRFYWSDRNLLYHLFGLLVPGFMSRESENFAGILSTVQLNPVPVFGAKKIPVPFDGNFPAKFFERNFLYHLFGLLVPGFMSRESEKFTGIF